jgi:hypothetical protein
MNSATRISRSIYVRVVIVVVATGVGASLGFAQGQPAAKPQAQSQTAAASPCGAAGASGSATSQSAANASAAVKNAANAVSNLGSLFGKKKPAQPANQGSNPSTNQPANQSAEAAAACDPTVNAAAGAAAGVASTVDAVEGAPAAGGTGATPGAAEAQPGAAARASGAPAAPGAARVATTPAAKASANSAAPPAASAAATSAPATSQPAAAAGAAPWDSSAPPNFAKLPDVNGIQLGMTNDQVLAKIKALYPGAPPNTTVALSYVKFEKTADKPWLGSARVVVLGDTCGGQCQEDVSITLNGPPDEPRAIFVTRSLGFDAGKRTTVANIKAALLQKYGQRPAFSNAQTMSWIFDEQGNPLNDPKFNGTQCAGIILNGGGYSEASPSNPNRINGPIGMLTESDLKNPCQSGVHVKADVLAQADGLVYALNVTMSENSYAMRAFVHELAYTQNIVNQEQQQKIKKAQDTAAPTL